MRDLARNAYHVGMALALGLSLAFNLRSVPTATPVAPVPPPELVAPVLPSAAPMPARPTSSPEPGYYPPSASEAAEPNAK